MGKGIYIDKARQGSEGTTPSHRSSASSAAAGLRWRLGSLLAVQLYRLRELVVKLHFGLLKTDKIVDGEPVSAAPSFDRKTCKTPPKNPTPISQTESRYRLGFLAGVCYLFKGVACNSLEGLLNIDCLLGTGFEIWDVVLALTPSLCSLGCYLKHKGVYIILQNNRYRTMMNQSCL